MSNDINFENKLKALHLEDHVDNFSKSQIDILYKKFIKDKELVSIKNKNEVVLYLINSILKKIGEKRIDNILDFKLEKQHIYILDGYIFVKDYSEHLDKLEVNINLENYNKKTKQQKKYFNINLLTDIFNSINLKIELYSTTKNVGNKKTTVQKFRVNIKKL